MLLLDNAIKYAKDVVSCKEITTWEVETQCKWFLEDLEKQKDDNFKYYFDLDKLKIINNLLKLFNFATGFVAGKQVLENLVGFQCFLIANIFGWRFKENSKKFRYNDITLYIARKNAKTALVGLIFLMLMLTEQNYSEFYSICLTKELAAEIRKNMVQILESSPIIARHFTWSKAKIGIIECNITHSFFLPRTAESGKNNSIRPSAFVSDEHANFTDNSNYSAMKSGQKNVINPIRFKTTTAYAIDNSIMETELEYSRKVFKGEVEDDRMFAMLYYAYEENLWNDTGMYQANPLRIEENYETIREERKKALQKEDEVEEYLTKAMNYFMPANAGEEYVTIEQIQACKLKEEYDWEGKEVFVGLDLAETDDNTAVAMVTRNIDTEEVFAKAWAFIPKLRVEAKSQREHVDYNREIQKGNCFACGDDVISYKVVENFIIKLQGVYGVKIKQVGYDRRNALSTAEKLENEGLETVEVVQHSRFLHPAIKWLKEMILSKKFHYNSNKLLEINFVNARQTEDTNLNKYLNKKKSKGKIDLVMSIVDALYLLLEELNKYEDNSIDVI